MTSVVYQDGISPRDKGIIGQRRNSSDDSQTSSVLVYEQNDLVGGNIEVLFQIPFHGLRIRHCSPQRRNSAAGTRLVFVYAYDDRKKRTVVVNTLPSAKKSYNG